jgi:hypothetical protein
MNVRISILEKHSRFWNERKERSRILGGLYARPDRSKDTWAWICLPFEKSRTHGMLFRPFIRRRNMLLCFSILGREDISLVALPFWNALKFSEGEEEKFEHPGASQEDPGAPQRHGWYR